MIVFPQVFFQIKMEGLSHAMIFLYGRIMVLSELLMGLGQLVTDSRFSAVNPYSSRVYSTGPEGSLPFFKEKPWIVSSRDSNMGRDARGAHAPGFWLLAGPSLSTLTLKVPGAVVEPVGGPTLELLGLDGPSERF